jgi:hypothetical protein
MVFTQHNLYNIYTTRLHGVGPMWAEPTTRIVPYVSPLCKLCCVMTTF